MTETFSVVIVEEIPAVLTSDTLYVSLTYSTSMHLCACGCGAEVVAPLSPTDWRLTFNGTWSLSPSIGNWALPCRSHYLIIDEKVHWAGNWDDDRIARNRANDRDRKDKFYDLPTQGDEKKPHWWVRKKHKKK